MVLSDGFASGRRWAFAGLVWLAALLAPAAWAQPIGYTGTGQVGAITPVSGSGPAVFLAQGTYELGALGDWDLLSTFIFNVSTGLGTGGFDFSQGGSSFSGTIATTQTVVASLPGFEIVYTVTGGTGAFAGATGFGEGIIVLTGPAEPPFFNYIEAGILNVSVVPEPATALLMLGGVAALLGRRLAKAR